MNLLHLPFNFHEKFSSNSHLISIYILIKLLLLLLIIQVKCQLKIHESNIWIPLLDNQIVRPFFLYHPTYNFIPMEFSPKLNTNISISKSSFYIGVGYQWHLSFGTFLFKDSNLQRLLYIFVNDKFLPPFYPELCYSTNKFISPKEDYAITLLTTRTFSETNPTEFTFAEEYWMNKNQTLASKRLMIHESSVEISTTLNLKFSNGFSHENLTYWSGYQEFNDNLIVFFISQLEVVYENFDSRSFFYREIFSDTFILTHGYVSFIKFVNSDSFNQIGMEYFSKLLLLKYEKNGKDFILMIPFEIFLSIFTTIGMGENCSEEKLLWMKKRITLSIENADCMKSYQNDLTFMWQKIEFEGYHIELLNENWTQILDLVPLSLELSTPGYLFLVLSSDSRNTKYRYSVHLIRGFDNYSQLHEEIFVISSLAFRTVLYYYNISNKSRVLISLDDYHYDTELDLCKFELIPCEPSSIIEQNNLLEKVIVMVLIIALLNILFLVVSFTFCKRSNEPIFGYNSSTWHSLRAKVVAARRNVGNKLQRVSRESNPSKLPNASRSSNRETLSNFGRKSTPVKVKILHSQTRNALKKLNR